MPKYKMAFNLRSNKYFCARNSCFCLAVPRADSGVCSVACSHRHIENLLFFFENVEKSLESWRLI